MKTTLSQRQSGELGRTAQWRGECNVRESRLIFFAGKQEGPLDGLGDAAVDPTPLPITTEIDTKSQLFLVPEDLRRQMQCAIRIDLRKLAPDDPDWQAFVDEIDRSNRMQTHKRSE
jgi:hypothetical protein